MNAQSPGSPRGAASGQWVTLPGLSASTRHRDAEATEGSDLPVFRILAWSFLCALVAMTVRTFLMGLPVSWAEYANMALLIAVLFLVARRPDWRRPLEWVVLLSLFTDVVDGILPLKTDAVVPSHMFMPFLVLYGALLGNLAMMTVSLCFVLAAFGCTWVVYHPLQYRDAMMLSNLSLASVAVGVAAFGVWLRHRDMVARLDRQAGELRGELDARLRLNSVIFHDISNPLTALVGYLHIAVKMGKASPEELEIMDRMTRRIAGIIESVRDFEGGRARASSLSRTRVQEIWKEISETLGHRLKQKEQTLVLSGGGEVEVLSDARVLASSVLCNLVTNAIKFSPRGAGIELSASVEGGEVRITVCDRGAGFPVALIGRLQEGRRCDEPMPGTEGEAGTGCGLRIASLYLAALQGRLEIRNRDGGGACAAVVLPRAT